MTSVTQYQPYCQTSDVMNLIGDVINNSDFNASAISTFINEAVQYIDKETSAFFSPRRMIQRYDGNGKSRMVLAHSPLMSVNKLSVFFTYPLTLSRIANEWDLLVDNEGGTVSFPTYTASPVFAPYAFVFYPASQNVEVDAWFGYTKQIFAEQLKTTDNKTYTLANPSAIKRAETISYPYEFDTPPAFYPVVYKNGQAITNTTYKLVTSVDASPNTEWEVDQDNLVYTVNQGANGITGFTFNTPCSAGDVITCDYVYWFIPPDIQIATAKRAAINILGAIASSSFGSNSFDGFDRVQVDGSMVQANNGQWGALVQRWHADISDTVSRYRKLNLDYQGGYIPDVTGGFWF